jgi:hypothetical protein
VTENSDLQFERAQFDDAAPQPGCQICTTPLRTSYFEVNGRTVCEGCCSTLRAGAPIGSRAGRVLRSIAAGAGVGLAGAIVYWAILAGTGYEFGLIAIVVGFGVGKAVHWGSRARGGWAYQTLAMALTYLAIVSAYVPMIVIELRKPTPADQAETAPPDGRPADVALNATAATTEVPAAGNEPVSLGVFLLSLGAILLIACALPFLSGFQNIIGVVIIGIGMYEAWKLNRHLPLVITGPHTLASSTRL